MTADFTTIRTFGPMLPSDLLGKVIAGDQQLPGLTPSDYHLASGETAREAANRAWSYLSGVWTSFRAGLERLPDGDPAVGLTREKWLLLLFRELGYGRPAVTPPGGLLGDDKQFPVSHLWEHVPLHLLGWGVELDRRSKGIAGAAERPPHAMVQELLNRNDDYLWAVVSNGQTLRLLRDSSALSGHSYLEFDLAAMFDGEVFSDFVMLFLLLHQSRVEILKPGGSPADCWLEKWRTASIESGTRALNLLRGGVQSAITALGTGFLQHPANGDLRTQLETNDITLDDFHRSLLRLVYRLLFLFVVEDRQLLQTTDGTPLAKARDTEYFSTARLRVLSHKRRGTRHGDLWEGLSLVISSLGNENGCAQIALPGIGGLFDDGPADVITGHHLSNNALLSAIRSLSVVQPKGQPLRVVDYRNLGAEELGSIYESLLELVPRLDATDHTFTLESLAGNERKTSGSYYTPTSLINLVLDEALDPLLTDAEKSDDPGQALLALRICDPACGSGHFLVAAARRIADRLSVVRTGDVDPTPADQQEAMYDVVANCIYGVDVNPMAAELAKVSLWLEAIRPGRALTFLDAHIKVGNSLIGATPALIAGGIPDAAYTPIEGDERKYAAALKKQNKVERDRKQEGLLGVDEVFGQSTHALREQLAAISPGSGTSLADTHEAHRRYTAYQASPELDQARLLADAWCAAFVQVLRPGSSPITEATLRAIEAGTAAPELVAQVRVLAARYRFFHWYLEFPEIFDVPEGGAATKTGWRGGFDALLGNPPWEHIELKEQEFFASREPAIALAAGDKRKQLIKLLPETNPPLYADYVSAKRQLDGMRHFASESGRYPLTGRGRVKTDSIFAETFRDLAAPHGRSGVIVPTGIATDATTQYFFRDLVEKGSLAALYDFENRAALFEGVDSRMKFCTLIMAGSDIREPAAKFAFFLQDPIAAPLERFEMTPEEITLLNPNTGTCPIFRTRRDAEITLGIYRRVPVLVRDGDPDGNPWGVSFMQGLFNMTSDSHLFRTREQLEDDGWTLRSNVFHRAGQRMLPLYEAKMIHQYDHRWATYEGIAIRDVTLAEKLGPSFSVLSRYWVQQRDVELRLANHESRWHLVWRGIARTTDVRTAIFSLLPAFPGGGNFDMVFGVTANLAGAFVANSNSFVYDYVIRQKLANMHLQFSVAKQLPAPPPSANLADCPWDPAARICDFATARVLELSYTSMDLAGYAAAVGDHLPPFEWDDDRRATLRAELDAAFFHLYGIDRDDVDYILDTFPIVKRKDEAKFGEFRTKRLILEVYADLAEASVTGEPFVSRLDPPPGHGRRHPARNDHGH